MLGKSRLRNLKAAAGHSSRSLGSVRAGSGPRNRCRPLAPAQEAPLCLHLCPEPFTAEPGAPALLGLHLCPVFRLPVLIFFSRCSKYESHCYQQHHLCTQMCHFHFSYGACGLLPAPFTAPCQCRSGMGLYSAPGWLPWRRISWLRPYVLRKI